MLSDLYLTSNDWQNDWRIHICRWSGVVAFVIGTFKALVALLDTQWSTWRAKRQNEHFLVAGNGIFARQLVTHALESGKVVHWLTDDQPSEVMTRRGLMVAANTKSGISQARPSKAEQIVVCMEDDSKALTLASRLRKSLDDPSRIPIKVRIESPWLDLHITGITDTKHLYLFSEPRLAVRAMQRLDPPFLLAKELTHTRLHTVIIGFGAYGEAVLMETLLNARTRWLGVPKFTIVDPRGDALIQQLELRYPELLASADICVLPYTLEGTETPLTDSVFKQIYNADPITLTTVCQADVESALSAALAIEALLQRNNVRSGPVFVRRPGQWQIRDSQSTKICRPSVIGFGSIDDVIQEAQIYDHSQDQLAKRLHAAYRELAPEDKHYNLPWDDLPEDIRVSNRRAADHLPAKIASLSTVDNPRSALATLVKGHNPSPALIATEEDLHALSVLEHERWMADRRLNGWRHGQTRNNDQRFHPDLIQFDNLPAASQAFDRRLVEIALHAAGVSVVKEIPESGTS